MNHRPPFTCDAANPADRAAAGPQTCAWQGCASAGEYRAPKDRTLREYYRFCLEHVRAYNAKWDFHAGLSAADVEAEIRRASTWERPTWKLGTLGAGHRPERMHVHDPFGFTGHMGFDADWQNERTAHRERHKGTGEAAQAHGVMSARNHALHVFDLRGPVTLEVLKQRYKALVKQHHPDANGGSPEAENRMKIINEAYQTLRATLVAAV